MNESSNNQSTFCSKCGAKVLIDSAFCRSCGAAMTALVDSPSVQPSHHGNKPNISSPSNGLNNKWHITLICAASFAVILLYTTMAIPLIGAATGICFGLSIRLFLSYKKINFIKTNKLDWYLIITASTIALILLLTGDYNIQALFLIFIAARSLMMYFTINNKENAEVIADQ